MLSVNVLYFVLNSDFKICRDVYRLPVIRKFMLYGGDVTTASNELAGNVCMYSKQSPLCIVLYIIGYPQNVVHVRVQSMRNACGDRNMAPYRHFCIDKIVHVLRSIANHDRMQF